MITTRTFFLVLIVAMMSSTLSQAQIALPWVESITPGSTEEVSIFNVPGGFGRSFSQAVLYGGEFVDATILLRLVDDWGVPIPGFPSEDIWLDAEVATAQACPGGFQAHSVTDMDGQTFFTETLSGGGWTEGPVWIYLNGMRASDQYGVVHQPVPLRFNSADINGDGMVDLVDVAYFSSDFYGSYSYRSDFYWDGQLTLADVGLLAVGLGHSCD